MKTTKTVEVAAYFCNLCGEEIGNSDGFLVEGISFYHVRDGKTYEMRVTDWEKSVHMHQSCFYELEHNQDKHTWVRAQP